MSKELKIQPTAAIVAIGTEVTSGQIENKNALNLARMLTDIGIEVIFHIACPDFDPLIQNAFQLVAKESDFIFVTGGLGPTSDDITRESIAGWTGSPLIFNEKAWEHVQTILESKGRQRREIHRQQCYFPENSEILKNELGTANGFALTHSNIRIFVLPGPPKEIQGIWEQYIDSELRRHVPVKKMLLATWLVSGRGESEFAEIAEEVLKGTNVKIGYRLVWPDVEVKVWIPADKLIQMQPCITKMTEALGPFLKKFSPPC